MQDDTHSIQFRLQMPNELNSYLLHVNESETEIRFRTH